MTELQGLKILVVEDDVLLAMELEDLLSDLGADVVGPCGRVEEALDAVVPALDGALLDLNLRGEPSFPVLQKLQELNVPVIVCSGYVDLPGMQEQLGEVARVSKPYAPKALTSAMRETFALQATRGVDVGENTSEQTRPVSG